MEENVRMSEQRSPVIDILTPTDVRQVGDAQVAAAYGDTTQELSALRERSVMLDLHGVSWIDITGDAAAASVDRLVTKDVEFLFPQRTAAALVLDVDGSVVDAVIVHRTADGFALEGSIGSGTTLLEHVTAHVDGDVVVRRADDLWVAGLEGPQSWEIVGDVFGQELVGLPYQEARRVTWNDTELLIVRVGHTSEFGFRIYGPTSSASALAATLRERAPAAGYDALLTAMLEDRQPCAATSGFPSVTAGGLQWLVDARKADFVGRRAVIDEVQTTLDAPIGVIADEPIQNSAVVSHGGASVGVIERSTFSPTLDKWLGVAVVDRDVALPGETFSVATAEGESVTARSVSSPYVVPRSWFQRMG
jgi:glycine cleavage system aminomethyltransferase T